MSANPSTLILTNPRTALRGDIEVGSNLTLVFAPPAGGVQIVGTDSSVNEITGGGVIRKQGDGALYINAIFGQATNVEPSLYIDKGTLGGTGTIWNLKDIYVGVRNSFDAVTLDPGSAPNKVGSLSISFKNADVSSDMDANIVFHVDIGETGYDKMDFSNSGSKGFSAKGFAVDIATVGGHYDDDGSGRAIITNIPLRSTFTDSTLYAFKGVAFSGAAGATSNLNASYRFDPDPVYPSGDPPTPISILLRTSSVAARSLTWTTGVGTWTAGYNGWAGGDSTFKHGDTVTFAASDSNDIAVATAGVIVGSMDVSAAGSSYTFTGGAIVGGTFHASDGTSWTTGNLTISNGATATFNNRIDFEEIVIKDAGSKLILGDASVSPAPDTQLTYGQKFYLGDGTSPSGTLEFAKSAPYTFMGLVSGKGTISQTGTGPLTLTGRLNTLGYMDENDAQFAALGRKFEFTGKLFIAAARTIIFDIDEGITQALKGDIPTGNIVLSGSGTLEKIGDGTLALEGLPDFQQGTINVKQGTLYLKADVAGGNSGFHRLGNATLELEGTHSGNWKLESMRSTISVPSGSVAFSGNLTSLADTQLVKAGVGNLILTGNNGYVGDTRIEAGTLTLQGPLDNTPNVPTRPFSDYTGNIYISAGTSLKLENQISSDDINDVRRYQMFSGNIYGTGSIVIDTTPQSMGMSGNMIRSNIYDFNGKVEAPLTVTKGTIGGSGFIQNVTLTSTVTQVDANSPRLASVVISPGNNWIEFEADGAHFKDGTNVIGSLTLGSAAGILTLQNIELLIDVKKGNISDRLLIYGNANWGTGNILNIRTDPNNMEAWDESTYVIARANPDGTKPGEFTNLQATLTNTEIQLNGLPVKNTRLQAALTFADVLTTTKPVGYSSLSAAGANEGAKYSAGGDKSTIILKTKGGVSEVIYWQGYAINGRDNEWTASHNNGALNWKWDGGDGDGARVIAFWDGDAVFFSEKDGPSSSTPGLVGAKNLQIIAETPTNPADPRTVYVASMFVEGKDYTFNGDKITGSMTSSTGADIQATNSLEEFLWLTGKLVITQTGKATFKNDISFFDIAVQGPETTKNPYFENFTPLAATGGEATFEGKTYISSEVLTVGRYATARLAGAGEFLNVTKIAVGNNGKFIFNKDLDYSFDGAITNMPILNTDPSSEAYGSVTAYDGSGSLEKSGSGKVTLSGTHTYDGTTTVSGGILAITGVLGAYEEVAAQETTRQVPHYAKNITLSNGAILSLSPSLPIIYDSEGNPIEEEPFEGMERPEQIIGSASTISGVGTIRKEGTGILTFEANTLPSTVKFEHIAGVLAGGYVGAVVTIPDITFSQGAIISPGARPVRYSSDGPRYSNVSGTGITFNENNKFGRMTFGVAGNTTTFNGIQYDIDINPDNEATSDFIRVVGDAEFGVEAPNTVSLGRVGSFTNKAYVVLGVTGTLTIPANLANTVILYDSAGITDPRNRVALVAGENGHANYVVDGNSYPWNKVLLLRSFIHANIGLTWTGRNTDAPDTLNASWHQDNTEIRNWREDGDTNRYFKQADIVEFPSDVVIGDTPYDVGAKTVNISASGVIVGGMTVSGPGYVFTGNSILGTVNSSDGADPEKTTPNILATNKLTITEDGEAKFENSAVTFARMEVAGKAEFLNPAGTVLNITDTATPIAVSGLLVLKWNGTASPFHADSNKNILLSGAGSVEFNGPGTGGTGQITYPGVISGEGGIGGSDPYAFIKSGDGKIIMSADQSYSGATQVTGGHLEFNGTLGTVAPRTGTEPYIATYDGAIHVADGASLTLQVGAVGKTVVQTVNANVTAGEDATGTLIKTGPGRLNVNGTVATTFQAQAGVLGGTGTFQKGATISAGVLISAGRNNDVTGSVLTFETVGPSSVIIPAGAGMIIDIRNASLSNSIFVTGSLVFGGTEDSAAHPFYVNPIDQDGDWRAGKYLVATATTGITLASGADVLWYDGATVESDSRIGGRLIIIENETTHYKELWLLTYMASRGLVWWGTETGHGTDISDDWDSTTEDWKHFTGTYPPKENLTDPSEMTFFSDGDHALFLNNGAPQEVIVQSAGVKASAMTIGSNSDFTFNGTGKITGRDDIWISDDPNPFNPVNEGGLHIEATGKATFNNTGGLDFSGTILVEGDGTFNSRVTTPLLHVKFDTLEETATYARATLGNDGNFAGVDAIWVENAKAELVLNRTTKAGIYGGPIYGAGKLFKTGAEEMTLSGAVSLTGPITVSGGKLSITGSLGVKTGDDATAVTYTHSTGVISIAAGANLTINTLTKTLNASSVEVDFVQVIDSTAPGHPPTPEDRNYGTLRGAVGSILEIGGSSYSGDPDNPIRARGSHVIIADSYSPFQGNIVVNNGADLKITGRIGVFHDTWDKGTPSEATYWHTNYGGNIHLGNATSKITFASTADYQQISGGLTGLGTIEKSGYFPVYFTGDASGFSGATNIVNGNYFIDTATDYGKTGVALSGPFSVGTGAALYVELWRGNLTLNASTFGMAAGSGLVVRGNGGLNIVTSPLANTVTLANGINLHISVGAAGVDGSVRLLAPGDENRPVGDIDPLPTVAKVSFRSATTGTVRKNENGEGVVLPAQMNLSLAYNPTPALVLITLLDGIDTAALPNSVATSSENILAYLGLTNAGTGVPGEIYIGSSTFKLAFTARADGIGRLMLMQTTFVASVPEPSTYVLWGTGLLVGLAYLRRRKNKKNGTVGKGEQRV
jgi:autotransporter-associated beta strand protein